MTPTKNVLIFAIISSLLISGAASADCKIPKHSGCRDLSLTAAPPNDFSGLSELRLSIIKAAQSQVGQVSEFNDGNGDKCGWEHLVDYYGTAYDRPLSSGNIATLRAAMFFKTVPDPDHEGKTKVIADEQKVNDWCGIFALWAVKTGAKTRIASKGLLAAGWRSIKVRGWGVDGIPFIVGNKGIQPGDIAYFTDRQHQAIVEYVGGEKLYTINGNMECQQIGRRAIETSSVAGYYRVE